MMNMGEISWLMYENGKMQSVKNYSKNRGIGDKGEF
jgi:antitoxin component YwqK of YwqJK toxin-antitoxin module